MSFRPGMVLACALAAAALAFPATAGEGWRASGHGPIPAERQAGPREPAWRHPHAFARPSPDRVYFPPAPPRGDGAG